MARLSPRIALAAGCSLLVSLGLSGCSDDQAGASTPKPTVMTPTQTTTPTLSEKDAAIESAKEAYIKYNDFKNEIYSNGGDLTKVDPLGDFLSGDALQETIESAANYKSEGRSRTGGLQIADMTVSEYTPSSTSGTNEFVTMKVCLDNSSMHVFTNGVERTRSPVDVGKALNSVELQRSSANGPWIVTEHKQIGKSGSC